MAEFLFATNGPGAHAHSNQLDIKVIFAAFRDKVCDATDKSNCRLSPIIDSTNSAMKLCKLDTIELVGSSRHDAAEGTLNSFSSLWTNLKCGSCG